jgi:hypothetical protein
MLGYVELARGLRAKTETLLDTCSINHRSSKQNIGTSLKSRSTVERVACKKLCMILAQH